MKKIQFIDQEERFRFSFYFVKGLRTVEQCKDCETNKTKIQNMEVRLAVVESKVIKIEESIEKISANTTWILRIIIGAIITALIGLLLKGGV